MEYIYSYIKTFLPANTKKDASLSLTFQNSDELDFNTKSSICPFYIDHSIS